MAYTEIIVPGTFTNTAGLLQVPDVQTGLLLDYDPDDLVPSVANGAAITSIASKGSNPVALDTQISTYTKPTLAHGAVNGHAALAFNGSQSLKTAANPVLFAEDANATFAAVFRLTGATDGRLFAASDLGSPTNYRALPVVSSGGGVQMLNNRAGTTVATTTRTVAQNAWAVAVGCNRGTAVELHTSLETTPRTATAVGPGAHAGLTLGVNTSASVRMTGQIARFLAFNRALTTADINALIDMLCTRYGITRTL